MVRLVVDSRGKPPDPEKGRKAIGSIVVEMRKDLLGKSRLTFEEFHDFLSSPFLPFHHDV